MPTNYNVDEIVQKAIERAKKVQERLREPEPEPTEPVSVEAPIEKIEEIKKKVTEVTKIPLIDSGVVTTGSFNSFQVKFNVKFAKPPAVILTGNVRQRDATIPAYRSVQTVTPTLAVPDLPTPTVPSVSIPPPSIDFFPPSVPSISIPPVAVPDVYVPGIVMPDFTIPSITLPKIDFKGFSLPSIDIPTPDIPKFGLPRMSKWTVNFYKVTDDTGTFGEHMGSAEFPSYFIKNWGDGNVFSERQNKIGLEATATLDLPMAMPINFHIAGDDGYELTVFIERLAPEFMPPSIDTAPMVIYEEGSTGNSITWHPRDTDPDRYSITYYKGPQATDGIIIAGGVWGGQDISINIDGLPAGQHGYRCTVYDKLGNSNTSTTGVIVTSGSPKSLSLTQLGIPNLLVSHQSVAIPEGWREEARLGDEYRILICECDKPEPDPIKTEGLSASYKEISSGGLIFHKDTPIPDGWYIIRKLSPEYNVVMPKVLATQDMKEILKRVEIMFDGGWILRIGDWGLHPTTSRSDTVFLQPGTYSLRIRWYEWEGDAYLRFWTVPPVIPEIGNIEFNLVRTIKDSFWEAWHDGWENIRDYIEDKIRQVLPGMGVDLDKKVAEAIGKGFSKIYTATRPIFKLLVGVFVTIAKIIANEIMSAVEAGLQPLIEIYKAFTDLVASIPGKIRTAIETSIKSLRARINESINALVTGVDGIQDVINTEIGTFASDVQTVFSQLQREFDATLPGSWSEQLGGSLTTALKGADIPLDELKDNIMNAMPDMLTDTLTGFSNNIRSTVQGYGDEILNQITQGYNKGITNFATNLKYNIDQYGLGIRDSLIESIKLGFGDSTKNLNLGLATLTSGLSRAIDDSLTSLYDVLGMIRGYIFTPAMILPESITTSSFEFVGVEGGTYIWLAVGEGRIGPEIEIPEELEDIQREIVLGSQRHLD